MREWVAETTYWLYGLLSPIYGLAFVVVFFLLIPLGLFSPTRKFSADGIYQSSFVFGASAWLLGASVSFAYFGWIGLIVGLLLFGAGVVPMGFLAAVLEGAWGMAFVGILLPVVLAYGTRGIAANLYGKIAEEQNSLASRERVGDRALLQEDSDDRQTVAPLPDVSKAPHQEPTTAKIAVEHLTTAGIQSEEWVVGRRVTAQQAHQYWDADRETLYAMTFFEKGEEQTVLLPRPHWNEAKQLLGFVEETSVKERAGTIDFNQHQRAEDLDVPTPERIPSACDQCQHFQQTGSLNASKGFCDFYATTRYADNDCYAYELAEEQR